MPSIVHHSIQYHFYQLMLNTLPRYSSFRIDCTLNHHLLNIIHTQPSPSDSEVVISPDAEKASDRVEWNYLFSTLRRFSFGQSFVSWICLLYSSPQASVCTNTHRSKLFPLSCGTCQGCLLSPLLYASHWATWATGGEWSTKFSYMWTIYSSICVIQSLVYHI